MDGALTPPQRGILSEPVSDKELDARIARARELGGGYFNMLAMQWSIQKTVKTITETLVPQLQYVYHGKLPDAGPSEPEGAAPSEPNNEEQSS